MHVRCHLETFPSPLGREVRGRLVQSMAEAMELLATFEGPLPVLRGTRVAPAPHAIAKWRARFIPAGQS